MSVYLTPDFQIKELFSSVMSVLFFCMSFESEALMDGQAPALKLYAGSPIPVMTS